MLMCHTTGLAAIMLMFICVNSISANLLQKQNLEVDSYTSPRIVDGSQGKISMEASKETKLEESRGWKKTALPFLLGITLKMTTLLPMISSLMTVIGGVALIASKLALIISIGLAVHYYLAAKHQMQYYRQPLSHSSLYDSVLPVTPYPVSHRLSVQSS